MSHATRPYQVVFSGEAISSTVEENWRHCLITYNTNPYTFMVEEQRPCGYRVHVNPPQIGLRQIKSRVLAREESRKRPELMEYWGLTVFEI